MGNPSQLEQGQTWACRCLALARGAAQEGPVHWCHLLTVTSRADLVVDPAVRGELLVPSSAHTHRDRDCAQLSTYPLFSLPSGLVGLCGLTVQRGENTFQELQDLPEVTELTWSRLCLTKNHIF